MLKTMASVEILREKGCTLDLHVRSPEPPTLSIGSGDTIAQKIHTDTSNPRMWDAASSKILYFHLVNSTEFKTITGFASPKPPILPDEYASSVPAKSVVSERRDVRGEDIGADEVPDHLVSMRYLVRDDSSRRTENAHFTKSEYMTWSEGNNLAEFSLIAPKKELALLEPDQTVQRFQGLDKNCS
jgi:hypothetical protein